jgi:GR25 family glycosyltransferase involved in LPS biosynthesis
MNSGLNNFDIIYYINLEHRKDRYEHINNELSKTNINPSKINRIDGIYLKNFGILGCAKSHILALETFLKTPSDIQNCIIFEDDFTFTKPQEEVNELINQFFKYIKKYDVLMLASNTLNETPTPYPFITKIIDAQTLSGYSVSKQFAPILLNNYKTSVAFLEKLGKKVHYYCFDIYMKQLQPTSLWFCINPRIGKQIESYSDIENRVVTYDC